MYLNTIVLAAAVASVSANQLSTGSYIPGKFHRGTSAASTDAELPAKAQGSNSEPPQKLCQHGETGDDCLEVISTNPPVEPRHEQADALADAHEFIWPIKDAVGASKEPPCAHFPKELHILCLKAVARGDASTRRLKSILHMPQRPATMPPATMLPATMPPATMPPATMLPAATPSAVHAEPPKDVMHPANSSSEHIDFSYDSVEISESRSNLEDRSELDTEDADNSDEEAPSKLETRKKKKDSKKPKGPPKLKKPKVPPQDGPCVDEEDVHVVQTPYESVDDHEVAGKKPDKYGEIIRVESPYAKLKDGKKKPHKCGKKKYDKGMGGKPLGTAIDSKGYPDCVTRCRKAPGEYYPARRRSCVRWCEWAWPANISKGH